MSRADDARFGVQITFPQEEAAVLRRQQQKLRRKFDDLSLEMKEKMAEEKFYEILEHMHPQSPHKL